MPMQETSLPVGATALKFTANGRDYPVLLDTDSFDRAGEDGDVPIIPLSRGDEGVGEVLEGQWKKGWNSDIDTFTARCNGGIIELTGVAAIAGTGGYGWINSTHCIPLMNATEVNVAMQTPVDDSGGVANRDLRFSFFIRQDRDEAGNPQADDNFLRIYYDIDETGLLFMITKEVGAAATGLFSGSTYDDASGRAVGDLEGTIWRLVFHDGHAGAAAPSDDRHVHIYLKQSDTIANAESATENELTTSPYDISDFLFDVGYPAFSIFTENTTYWGTAIGSANGVDVGYLRVDYPSHFSLKYDFADADYGKGDVELWDGDPDNSASIRVFDEDHDFTNDVYIQNGLIRLHVDDAVQYGLKMYAYVSAAWTQFFVGTRIYLVTDTTNLDYPHVIRIIQVSSEKSIVSVKLTDTSTDNEDFYVNLNITLERGKLYFTVEPTKIYPAQETTVVNFDSPILRFGYVGDDSIGDDDLNVSSGNTTMSDNFLVGFDDAGKTIIETVFVSDKPDGATKRFLASDGGSLYIEYYLNETALDAAIFWGATPFALVANLFEEAESATLGGGASAVADGAASGGQAVLLNAQNEQVYYQITAGTHLPAGRYLAAFRIRDTNQVANDVGIYVFNGTDVSPRNEEAGEVSTTVAAAYAYYGHVFDITAEDVSGGDAIRLRVKKLLADANSIYVDYILIIPIGNGEDWPQDLAHAALRRFNKPRRLFER